VIQSLFISVDPYQRIQQSKKQTWEEPHPLGEIQGAGCIGRVVESKHADFKAGDIVSAYTGWRRYAVVAGEKARKLEWDSSKIPVCTCLACACSFSFVLIL
jgi:NADPH-dependent curcumin reductase CurA